MADNKKEEEEKRLQKKKEAQEEEEDRLERERFERELKQEEKEAEEKALEEEVARLKAEEAAKKKALEEEAVRLKAEKEVINPIYLNNESKIKIKNLRLTKKDLNFEYDDEYFDFSEGCRPNLKEFDDGDDAEVIKEEIAALEVRRKELELEGKKYKKLLKEYWRDFNKLDYKLCDKPHKKKGGKTRRSKYQDSKLFHKKKGGKTRRSKYQDSK